MVSLDFSHQELVIAHVIFVLTWAKSFSEILSIPLVDTVISTSDIIMAVLVGNEIMLALTYESRAGVFSYPQARTLAVTGSPSRRQRSAW